jgi:Nif-specific regulatory protein
MGTRPEPDFDEKLPEILAISRKMNSERDLGALLDLMAREATSLLACDRSSIFLLDREKNELWSQVALGSDRILRFDARFGVAGHAVSTSEVVNVSDAYHDPRFYNAIDYHSGYRTRSLLAVPVRNQRAEIIGAFEALNKHAGAFTARDEACLLALASQAAVAIETAQLVGSLRRSQHELAEQNGQLQREVERRYSTHGIICAGARMQQVVRLIERISDSSVSVLITGESGTGKELAAKAIHYSSARSRKPFVALNCAALPDTLVESELFGIEKGVATGVESRIGHFQRADGGTLFLDEIGDLSLASQAKILRVLQERVVERVGGRTPVRVDVRLLAATNRDLGAEIGKGAFREDLFYRLNVVHIHMPPLREIREEIPLLANHFLNEYVKEAGREPLRFSHEVLGHLTARDWPGNVRQLRNEVMRLAACNSGPVITEDLWEGLPFSLPQTRSDGAAPAPPHQTLKQAVDELERRMLVEALQATRNNQLQAARQLGLSRQGLINKMKRHGLG